MNKPLQILLVEDDLAICEIAKISLKKTGDFAVDICNNGQDCLDYLQKNTPDLILLDVVMPGIDGPTTLKKIKSNPKWQNIKTAFITAKVHPEDIEVLKLYGADTIISKPFNPITLPNEINKICNL